MKFVFMFSFLLSGASALACPQISGTYKCYSKTQPLKITQQRSNNITTYVVHGDVRVADNKVRDLPDSGQLIGQKYRAFCNGDTFSFQQIGKTRDGSGKIDIQMDLYFDADKFIYKTTGFFIPVTGNPVSVDDYITCDKQKSAP